MPPPSTPFYLDWTFWAVIVSFVAIILSQLPPVLLWFRPRHLDVEVHSSIQVTHKVGNPNVGMYVSVRNTGGRELRIRSLKLGLTRDNNPLLTLVGQNYFETPSSLSAVLLVPFTLKPNECWGHRVNFWNQFDRATERLYRESESALIADIRAKLQSKPENDKDIVIAEPELVVSFLNLFEKMFLWLPGEYVVELIVDAQVASASCSKKFRFTLYESDTAELKSHTADYKAGGGISYNVDKHAGLSVPLSEHVC
jgi:hypothetical protein